MKKDSIGKTLTTILLTLFLCSSPVFAYYPTVTPWPMWRYDGAHTASSPSSSPNNNAMLWKTPGDWYGSAPTVTGGLVFVVDNDGTMHCFDETTGVSLWTQHLAYSFQGEPAAVGDRLYAGAENNYMYVLNAITGVKVGEYYGESGYATTSPVVSNGKVYFGSTDGYLYALDANDLTPIWAYHAGGGISSSPAVDEAGVYFGCNDGKIYGLDATGTKKWDFYTGYNGTDPGWDFIYSSPSVANDMVFAGSSRRIHSVFAINETSGAFIWNYTLTDDNWASRSTAFSEGFVYFTHSSKVYKLLANASSGSYAETDSNIRKGVYDVLSEASDCSIAGGKLFVSAWMGGIYALNKTSALSLVWSYVFSNYIASYSSPVVADGRIFVPTWGSGLACFGEPFPPTTSHYTVNAGGQNFDLAIETNSTISNLNTAGLENQGKINFTVAGISGTTGMSNVTIPNGMLSGELNVTIDGEQPLYLAPPLNNGTHTSLYFTYNITAPHTVEISGTTYVPELHLIMIAPLMTAILFAVLIKSKRIARLR